MDEHFLSYSEDVMERIKDSNHIVDVISELVPVKRHGDDIIAQCPFDGRGGYTLLISDRRQLYQCTECGASGNVFSFVMDFKKIPLKEAVEYLAGRAGISLPEPQEVTTGEKERRGTLAINRETARFYYNNMVNKRTMGGLKYLTDRGLSGPVIKRFGIGYASPHTDDLYRHLRSKGYTDRQMELAGVVSFYNGVPYDKFRNRVVCPIIDTDRNVVGFSGRIIGDGTPKYKNSPSTPVFDKKSTLYGLNFAQYSGRDSIIVCEGNLDVVSMHQAGFDNTVAPLGTAFTREHALILASHTDHVHLAFDSDEAGQKAALRAIPILREANIRPDIVCLEPYKDPDEFLKTEGGRAFDKRLMEAEESHAFEIRMKYGGYDIRDDAQYRKMMGEFAHSLVGLPAQEKKAYVDTMQDYIKAYGRTGQSGYRANAREASDTGITVLETPGDTTGDTTQAGEHPDAGDARQPGSVSVGTIDMSWMDDYFATR